MSDGQRYHLLKHHAQPSESYKFPTQYLGGANRSFKLQWIQECGWWLVYSCKVDGAFCICFALFAKERKNMASMVNAPFRKCHHKSEVITAHLNKPSQAAENFIQSIDNPEATITAMVDKTRVENIAETGMSWNVLQKLCCIVLDSALHSGETTKSLIPLAFLETFPPWWTS